jgi:hypothetical protein
VKRIQVQPEFVIDVGDLLGTKRLCLMIRIRLFHIPRIAAAGVEIGRLLLQGLAVERVMGGRLSHVQAPHFCEVTGAPVE